MGKDLNGKDLGTGITQRQDGRYMYRYTDTLKKAKCEYFSSETLAKRRRRDVEYEKDHNLYGETGDIRLDDWFDFWIDNKKNKVSWETHKNYTSMYNGHIKPVIGRLSMNSITPMLCQKLLNDMSEKGYAARTTAGIRTMIKTLFDDAALYGKAVKNPINKGVVGQRSCQEPKIALTEAEQEEFLEEAKKYSCYEMLRLNFDLGLRIAELTALGVEHIDFEKGFVRVERQLIKRLRSDRGYFKPPKTRSGNRKVPMTDNARDILFRRVKMCSFLPSESPELDSLLFRTRSGKPLYISGINGAIYRIVERVNENRKEAARLTGAKFEPFPDISSHAMRHTFATRCVERGVKPSTLKEILGHSTIATTMSYYVHISDDELTREMQKMNRR